MDMFSPILPIRPLRTSSNRRAESRLGSAAEPTADVGRVVLGHEASQRAHEGQESIVLGNEVGFAVDFDQRAGAPDDGRWPRLRR